MGSLIISWFLVIGLSGGGFGIKWVEKGLEDVLLLTNGGWRDFWFLGV
jgi:hypothetical protein